MCLEGRHAGALLQHQLGLFRFDHRYVHEHKQSQDRRPTHLLVRYVSSRFTLDRKEWTQPHVQELPKPLRRAELDSTPKRAHFCEDALVRGSLFPAYLELSPDELWPRLEEVMFTPLVERAFAGEDEEQQ